MDRDGTKSGYDMPLTRAIADAVHVPVIASGGVGSLDDLVKGVTEGHASAVLAASIFHFGEVSIAEAKAALAKAGLPVLPDPQAAVIQLRLHSRPIRLITMRHGRSPPRFHSFPVPPRPAVPAQPVKARARPHRPRHAARKMPSAPPCRTAWPR